MVLAQDRHERSHAHVGMGIKTEMPKAAVFIGQSRINRRVVEKQHTPIGLAFVVLVDRIDQRRCVGRRVALQNELRAVVECSFERRQSLFALAFAVVAREHHAAHALRGFDATARIDALHSPRNVAHHGFAGVGKWSTQALDQSQLDGRQ